MAFTRPLVTHCQSDGLSDENVSRLVGWRTEEQTSGGLMGVAELTRCSGIVYTQLQGRPDSYAMGLPVISLKCEGHSVLSWSLEFASNFCYLLSLTKMFHPSVLCLLLAQCSLELQALAELPLNHSHLFSPVSFVELHLESDCCLWAHSLPVPWRC